MLYITQGNTEQFRCGPIETADREPVDLSAATVKMIIKSSVDDTDEMAVFSQEIENSDSNIVLFNMSPTETRHIDVGHYIMGIKIVWDDGTEREILRDNVTVNKGVFHG